MKYFLFAALIFVLQCKDGLKFSSKIAKKKPSEESENPDFEHSQKKFEAHYFVCETLQHNQNGNLSCTLTDQNHKSVSLPKTTQWSVDLMQHGKSIEKQNIKVLANEFIGIIFTPNNLNDSDAIIIRISNQRLAFELTCQDH